MLEMFSSIDLGWFTPFLPLVIIWSMIWKGIGLWKSGRNNQFIWFVVMFLVNSVGLLPIIYIFWFQKNKSVLILPKTKPKRVVKKTKKK